MKARFVCKMSDARLVRNAIDRKEGQVHKYIVERTIYLSKEKFIHFRSHLLDDNDELINYRKEMYVDENKVWHVLMFCSMIADIMILVYSDGEDYAKYVSIISNGGEKVDHVLQLVIDILESEKMTSEMQLQLNKICELEDAFVKGFSKEK